MNLRRIVFAALAMAAIVVFVAVPPVPQQPDYHYFADRRTYLGIPNTLDVVSNVAFAVIGLLGLASLSACSKHPARFNDPWERWPYVVVFGGTLLTAIGSSHYHLAPDNGRLVWDRLPIAVTVVGLLATLVAERVGVVASRRLLLPLLAMAAASVGYWHWTELRGEGDLRPYGLVQFGSLLLVFLLLLVYPARYSGQGYLVAGLGLYGVAKAFEMADREVFALGQVVSGHTLKHLLAAGALAFVVRMLCVRSRPAGTPASGFRDRGR